MIHNVDGIQVNTNKKCKALRKGCVVRKIAAVFVASGLLFTAAACRALGKDDFTYKVNSDVSVTDQYELAKDIKYTSKEEEIGNQLKNYYIAVNNYKYYDNIDDENVDKINARMAVVTETKKMCGIASDAMELKVRDALGLTDEDVSFERTTDTGYNTDIIRVTKGKKVLFSFIENQVPKEITELMDDITEIRIYSGDGSNKQWNNQTGSYVNTGMKTADDILDFLDEDFELNNNELINSNKVVSFENNISKPQISAKDELASKSNIIDITDRLNYVNDDYSKQLRKSA